MRTKTEIVANGHRMLENKMFLALAWRVPRVHAAHWAAAGKVATFSGFDTLGCYTDVRPRKFHMPCWHQKAEFCAFLQLHLVDTELQGEPATWIEPLVFPCEVLHPSRDRHLMVRTDHAGHARAH